MSPFIIHEASDVDFFSEEEEEEEEEEDDNEKESRFVDDTSIFSDRFLSDYRHAASILNLEKLFENVEVTYKDAMKISDEDDDGDDESEDFSNFVFGSDIEANEDEFDKYIGWEKT